VPLAQEYHHGITPERVREIMFRRLPAAEQYPIPSFQQRSEIQNCCDSALRIQSSEWLITYTND